MFPLQLIVYFGCAGRCTALGAMSVLHCGRASEGAGHADCDDRDGVCRAGHRRVPRGFRTYGRVRRQGSGQDREPDRRAHADLRAGARGPSGAQRA